MKGCGSMTKKQNAPLSPEAQEIEDIAAAQDLARRQIQEGTASSQVITYYLKLGSSLQKLENERLLNENRLLQEKIKQIEENRTSEATYKRVLEAMQTYTGCQEEVIHDSDIPDGYNWGY